MQFARCFAGSAAMLVVGLWAGRDAMAWGKIGHRVASTLVENHLSSAAASAVRDLLEPGETLADASLWADEHKREIPGSAAWHYVNVPITEAQYDARFCPSNRCVVSKVEETRDVLKSPSASRGEKQRALRFLVHLVEDLHQPVHVGDRGDRGGNDLQLRFFGKGTNLHRIWDDGIIEHHSTDEAKWVSELEALATTELAHQTTAGSVEAWANESLTAARQAYCIPGTRSMLKPGTELGQEYYDLALPVVRHRLVQAAVRLTVMLNDIFAAPSAR
jgi:hypothetical protein